MSERIDGAYVAKRVLSKWWLILGFVAIGGMAAYAISLETEPVYEANLTLLVGDPSSAASVTKESIETSQLLATTYVNLIRSEPVLTDVADELGLETEAWRELKDMISTNTGAQGSQSIRVTVYDDSAESAQNIATAVGERALEFGSASTRIDRMSGFTATQLQGLRRNISAAEIEIAELEAKLATADEPFQQNEFQIRIQDQQELIIGWQNNYSSLLNSLTEDASANSIQVIDSAAASISPVRPNLPMNLGAGMGIGALMAIAIAIALAFRQKRIDEAVPEPVAQEAKPEQQPARAVTIRPTEMSGTAGGN